MPLKTSSGRSNRLFTKAHLLEERKWRRWWADALMFDALIGNTDRHQDNWGFLFKTDRTNASWARLMPLFDNGTSLGHERFIEFVATWNDDNYLRYIRKGRHHVSWSLDDEPRINGHFELLAKAVSEWPETKSMLVDRIEGISEFHLLDAISDLVQIPAPVLF